MKVYFAHCKAIYRTIQEKRDIEMMEDLLGWEVVNPADSKWDKGWKKLGMECAEVIMETEGVDIVVFRALPDGRIPAGVAKEIKIANEQGLPVLELPSGIISRSISVDETREFLREIGQR